MMSLNQTEALRIFNERYRSPTLNILAVGDSDVNGPERDPIFGFVPNAWYIRFYLEDRPISVRRTVEHACGGARQLKMRVTTLVNECNWNVAFNVNADSFIAWRSRQRNSARTLNHYLQAMVSFLNWAIGYARPYRPGALNLSTRARAKASTQGAAIARAFTKARTERSICFGVVAQSQTLIRMTALPCQVEPPHQHSPELWMFCSVALVRASSSHEASTWLKTTSL
jgi:hypothetical protein